MIMPLSLTLLSAAVPPERRNAALGIWGAIGGVAVAIGPLVGGAITTGWAWQYIFWLNVPIGVVLGILAWWKLSESRGYKARLDIRGVVLVSIGLFGVVYGLVQGNSHGWTSTGVLSCVRRRRRGTGRLRLVGTADREPDAAAAPLPQPSVCRRQRDRHAVQLRHVRFDLLPVPVPPDRPGLFAAERRAADPAVDRHDHGPGPDRGNPGRALGRQAVGRDRPDPAGGRPGLVGPAVDADHAVHRHGPGLHVWPASG